MNAPDSKSIGFQFIDKNAWIDPRRMFVSFQWHAEKSAGGNLTQADMVSTISPPSQGILSNVVVFVGESLLTPNQKDYGLISKINLLVNYTPEARKTLLSQFEGMATNRDE